MRAPGTVPWASSAIMAWFPSSAKGKNVSLTSAPSESGPTKNPLWKISIRNCGGASLSSCLREGGGGWDEEVEEGGGEEGEESECPCPPKGTKEGAEEGVGGGGGDLD